MTKVLHTVSGIWEHTGGPAESVPRLCSALVHSGMEVVVATLAGPLSAAALDCKRDGVDLRVYSHVKHCSLSICTAIQKLSGEVELLHGHGLWEPTNWATGLIAKFSGRPLVISPRGSLEPKRLEHSAWKKKTAGLLFDNPCLEYASCIHACSDMEYESIRSYGLKNPVAVIPNGVQLQMTSIEKLAFRTQFFEKYPALQSKKILLFISRISWEKGLPLLAEAWKSVSPQFKNWHLIIAGGGTKQYVREVIELFRSDATASTVSLVGLLQGDAKLAAFASADLFVLPTHSENFGIAIAEALAVGVPAITTYGAPWKEIQDRDCGWWVPVDTNGITKSLLAAMSISDTERMAMGERGRELINEKYTWPKIGANMANVYKWLLGNGSMPACIKLD